MQICQHYGLHEVIEQLCKTREENPAEARTIPSQHYVSVPHTQTDWEILTPEDFGRQPNVVPTFGPVDRENMKVPAQQSLEDSGEQGPDESDEAHPDEEAMDDLDEKAHKDPDEEDTNNPDEGDIDNLDEDSLDEDNLEHASAEVHNDVDKEEDPSSEIDLENGKPVQREPPDEEANSTATARSLSLPLTTESYNSWVTQDSGLGVTFSSGYSIDELI